MLLIKELENRGFEKDFIDFILEEAEIFLNDDEEIQEINREQIHQFVSFPRAYKLDDLIIGFSDLSKLMYYVGSENENELILKIGDLRIYRIENEDRFPVIEEE